jgi:hypothetical protein
VHEPLVVFVSRMLAKIVPAAPWPWLKTPLKSLAAHVVPAGFSVVDVDVELDVDVEEVDVVEGPVEWRLRVKMTTNAAKIASNLSARLTD